MKKALIGIGMLTMACVVCGPAFAAGDVPHHALPADANCANFTGYDTSTPPVPTFGVLSTAYGAPAGGSFPVYALTPSLDEPVTAWPTAGNYDFCAAFDSVSCSLGALVSFSSDILKYQSLFLCNTDINGVVNPTPPSGTLPVTANGIPDGEYELGLIAAVLNDTTNPHNAEVTAAFKSNYLFFKVLVTTALSAVPLKPPPAAPSDLRALVPGFAPYLVSPLVSVLAAYATEGDDTTLAALDELLLQLGALGIAPPTGGVKAHTTGFPLLFGPDGDADGDHFSNRVEYNYFVPQGSVVTIAAELNANITPPATVPQVLILGAGTYQVGDALDLTAAALNCAALTYQWSKDGAPIAPATASTFTIPSLALTDAGKYTVEITISGKGDKAVVDSNPVIVKVVPAGTLPIAGGLGLALLAGACALGGVGSIRRRK